MYFFGEHARWKRRYKACKRVQDTIWYHHSRTCVVHGVLDCRPCYDAWALMTDLAFSKLV